MDQFRRWFFPASGNSSFYCKYNDKTLQAYSAIMHFTGALASIPASYFTQHWGRKGYVHSKQFIAVGAGHRHLLFQTSTRYSPPASAVTQVYDHRGHFVSDRGCLPSLCQKHNCPAVYRKGVLGYR